ncbi:hypothetical protein Tco_1555124 [Tanacetum coccineum]
MWLRRGDDGGGVAGLRGTPAGGEGKWRVRSGGDGGIWQRREWLVRSYGDSSGGSQMAAGGGMATRGACWYGESVAGGGAVVVAADLGDRRWSGRCVCVCIYEME